MILVSLLKSMMLPKQLLLVQMISLTTISITWNSLEDLMMLEWLLFIKFLLVWTNLDVDQLHALTLESAIMSLLTQELFLDTFQKMRLS